MQLELRGITKRFGGFTANDAIDVVVEPGQIHALLGENGAGKSTLMNVLYGLYRAEEGAILLDGVEQHFSGPGDAMRAGIGMVHQHFMLVPVFTVAENVMLGHEPTKGAGVLDLETARARVREISARFGFDLDPDARIEDLPVGVQQRVEIVKALSRDAKVLVFDEPTAVLTPQETDELIGIMRQLKEQGTSIVFISHKLREVRAVADVITVIRRGKVVGSAEPTASSQELASLMVGRAVELTVQKQTAKPGDVALSIRGLSARNEQGTVTLDGVDLDIHRGEILAIAGVQGNGQTELANAIIGLLGGLEGSISLEGRELIGRSVKQVLDAGVGFVPEDRSHDGIVKEFTIAENLILDRSDREPFASGLSLKLGTVREFAEQKSREYDVRSQGIETKVGRLSGGNQQKVVLARELSRPLKLFIASQPTRGLDVGSIQFVHEQIVATRDAGVPVLIVSTELDEVVALADRIAVMYQGRIVDVVAPDTSRERLGSLMAGVVA